jgi:hypothetical protein
MKSIKHLFLALSMIGATSVYAEGTRVFHDAQGRPLEATFIKLEGDTVYLQVAATGQTVGVPVTRLSAEDQTAVKTLAPAANANAMTSVATNASAAEAAAKIDQLVAMGLAQHNVKPNPLLSDEQFVRRVYLDIAGRIPNYDETSTFLKKAGSDKTARAQLIDDLLASEGYVSNMYNYFAEMLRIKDRSVDGGAFVRGLPYIQWIKDQLRANTPYDKMVTLMLTAEGKIWENGAAGYLLRDSGMPLDNLANTLSVFLGTDVACAQCHDHPFANWTQRQFYEMAAFFGATTTLLTGRDYNQPKLMAEVSSLIESSGKDPKEYMNGIRNTVVRANTYVVQDLPENRTKLPPDYRYKDGKGGDLISPKLIHWVAPNKQLKDVLREDERNPAYKLAEAVERKSAAVKRVATGAQKQNPSAQQKVSKSVGDMNEKLRSTFAAWATHPSNPRFAMTIGNRMWARAMGQSLTANKSVVDNPDDAYNPALIKHLANEMVRVKFNLKEFLRIVYNTQTYQREATTAALAMGEPYYFQGPVLRRMSAEQAWDSYMTLVLGDKIDKNKNDDVDLYGRSVSMDLSNPKLDAPTVLRKYQAVRDIGMKERSKVGGGLAMAANEEDDGMKIATFANMKLMRASELEQPAPPGHFLREFGQSERLLIDGGVKSGSVPQVLMMMNGKAQEMLTNRDSLINHIISKQPSVDKKVEAVFLSILNRVPTAREQELAKKTIGEQGENEGFAAIIWALINTREFCFVQ